MYCTIMVFYNPETRILYTTGGYTLDTGLHINAKFGLKYDLIIFSRDGFQHNISTLLSLYGM